MARSHALHAKRPRNPLPIRFCGIRVLMVIRYKPAFLRRLISPGLLIALLAACTPTPTTTPTPASPLPTPAATTTLPTATPPPTPRRAAQAYPAAWATGVSAEVTNASESGDNPQAHLRYTTVLVGTVETDITLPLKRTDTSWGVIFRGAGCYRISLRESE